MTAQGELILISLAALTVGAWLPIAIQLFLTARTVQRTSLAVERQVGDVHQTLTALVRDVTPERRPSDVTAAIGAALVPAVVAAFRALRTPEPQHQEKTS